MSKTPRKHQEKESTFLFQIRYRNWLKQTLNPILNQ